MVTLKLSHRLFSSSIRRQVGLQVSQTSSNAGQHKTMSCPRWWSECRDGTKFAPVCMLCSVVIIYKLFCDAQMMTWVRQAARSSFPPHLESLRLDARRLDGRWTPAIMLALQYVFLPHVFCSVFKLNIVCVLSANALECISLEIFLRNGLVPVRAKCPY